MFCQSQYLVLRQRYNTLLIDIFIFLSRLSEARYPNTVTNCMPPAGIEPAALGYSHVQGDCLNHCAMELVITLNWKKNIGMVSNSHFMDFVLSRIFSRLPLVSSRVMLNLVEWKNFQFCFHVPLLKLASYHKCFKLSQINYFRQIIHYHEIT